MRIVTRAVFLTLPENTAFAKGKKWFWGHMEFKTESMEHDFASFDPVGVEALNDSEQTKRYDEMLRACVSFPMETADMRDGCFEDDDLFLIFEEADLLRLAADWIMPAISAAKMWEQRRG